MFSDTYEVYGDTPGTLKIKEYRRYSNYYEELASSLATYITSIQAKLDYLDSCSSSLKTSVDVNSRHYLLYDYLNEVVDEEALMSSRINQLKTDLNILSSKYNEVSNLYHEFYNLAGGYYGY
ncbi:MAG: hypothetical protein RR646_07975 [Erysipelotrichaceae bacterium]